MMVYFRALPPLSGVDDKKRGEHGDIAAPVQ
jgi:hypothetical protein